MTHGYRKASVVVHTVTVMGVKERNKRLSVYKPACVYFEVFVCGGVE